MRSQLAEWLSSKEHLFDSQGTVCYLLQWSQDIESTKVTYPTALCITNYRQKQQSYNVEDGHSRWWSLRRVIKLQQAQDVVQLLHNSVSTAQMEQVIKLAFVFKTSHQDLYNASISINSQSWVPTILVDRTKISQYHHHFVLSNIILILHKNYYIPPIESPRWELSNGILVEVGIQVLTPNQPISHCNPAIANTISFCWRPPKHLQCHQLTPPRLKPYQ